MQNFIDFWNKGLINKIVLSGTALFLLCCACGIGVLMLPTSDTPQSKPNLVDISTIVFETAQAINAQTLAAITPTSFPTQTQTSIPPTATMQILPTPTQAQTFSIPGADCIPNNPPQTGIVVDVVDGDTIKVLLDQDGKTYSIRYIGMDTPENTTQIEYFGAEATAKNSELVYGKTVTLFKDVSETDRYNRLLRYVIVDNIFVNYELVAQGYANVASYPPDISCIPTFQAIEQQASSASLGLWNAPPTLAPLPTLTPSSNSGGSGSAVCSCSSNSYNCGDFSTHASAQACYDYCKSIGAGDVHRLDADNNGIACENLP